VILCAHGELVEQASGTTVCICVTCSGVWAIRFLGSIFTPAHFFLVSANIIFFFFGSSASQRTFEGLHCEHRPASTVVRYFEQHTMSTHVNGATGALSMGPFAGYTSNLTVSIFSKVFVLLNMISMFIIVVTSSSHVHIFVVTNLLLFIWIKLNMKMPNFLTIQKLDIRLFSVSGFAAALKPNGFNDTNYKRWRAKMILWLTVMNCYQAA
jgi:hypothetical protein